MAGKPKFTNDQIAEALKAAGGIHTFAARMLSCSPNTITNRIKASKALQKIAKDVVDHNLDIAEAGLLKLIGEQHPPSIYFYLRTKGRERGYVERKELTAPEGGPASTGAAVLVFLPPNGRDDSDPDKTG